MPTSINSSGITFPNGTTQTTAAAASSYVGARIQAFTGSGTFTIPSGVTAIKVTIVGGGGGGGGAVSNNNTYGSGGGGGGGAIQNFTSLTPGGTLTVTVGAGGSASSGNGGTGGTTSVSSGTQAITTVSSTGGAGGLANNGGVALGGIGSGGSLNIAGSPSIWGWSDNGFNTSGVGGGGGSSMMGGGGLQVGTGSFLNGQAGRAYGGGGSGGVNIVTGSNASGGVGAAGCVLIEW